MIQFTQKTTKNRVVKIYWDARLFWLYKCYIILNVSHQRPWLNYKRRTAEDNFQYLSKSNQSDANKNDEWDCTSLADLVKINIIIIIFIVIQLLYILILSHRQKTSTTRLVCVPPPDPNWHNVVHKSSREWTNERYRLCVLVCHDVQHKKTYLHTKPKTKKRREKTILRRSFHLELYKSLYLFCWVAILLLFAIFFCLAVTRELPLPMPW